MSKIDTPKMPPAAPPAQIPTQLEGAITDQFFATGMQMAQVTALLAQEMVDFASRRMRAQLDFLGAMPNWSDPQEVMTAQFRFAADASKDYAEEMDHLTQVLRRVNDQPVPAGPRAA